MLWTISPPRMAKMNTNIDISMHIIYHWKNKGPVSLIRSIFPCIGISIIKVRRSYSQVYGLYFETGPWTIIKFVFPFLYLPTPMLNNVSISCADILYIKGVLQFVRHNIFNDIYLVIWWWCDVYTNACWSTKTSFRVSRIFKHTHIFILSMFCNSI